MSKLPFSYSNISLPETLFHLACSNRHVSMQHLVKGGILKKWHFPIFFGVMQFWSLLWGYAVLESSLGLCSFELDPNPNPNSYQLAGKFGCQICRFPKIGSRRANLAAKFVDSPKLAVGCQICRFPKIGSWRANLAAKFVDPPKLAVGGQIWQSAKSLPKLAVGGWQRSCVHPVIGKDQLCNCIIQPERSIVHPVIGDDHLCNCIMQPERSSSLDTITQTINLSGT